MQTTAHRKKVPKENIQQPLEDGHANQAVSVALGMTLKRPFALPNVIVS